MIILVTLMVAASRVLSVPIDDVPDSSYVAIDSSVPVRIDPATITRLFRDQSPYPVPSPPFNEGFYYTVPARLLLYQPPPGQSYLASIANGKEHSKCDNHLNPVTAGEYVQSSGRQYKRSSDRAGTSADLPTPINFPGEAVQYADYHDRRSYNSLSSNEVQRTPGNWHDSTYRANGIPQEDFPNSEQQYFQNMPVSYGQYPSVQNQHPHSGAQFPLYADRNILQYSESNYPGGSSETVSRQEGVQVGSGPQYQHPRGLISTSPSQPMVNYHEDGSNSYNRPPLDVIMPQSSLISPSYLVGFKLLTKPPLLSTQRRPIWDSPNPMGEPWASKMYEDSAYPASRHGYQSQPIESSRAAAASMFGNRPPILGIRSGTKVGTPWVVLMVPPDSLFRKEYNAGMEVPWLPLNSPRPYETNRKDFAFASQADTPSCKKINLDVAEPQLSRSNMSTEIKPVFTTEPQHPVSGSLEAPPLPEQTSGLEETIIAGAERSLVTEPHIKPQFQNQQSSTQVFQDRTIVIGGNVFPSAVTKYETSDNSSTQRFIEHVGEDLVIPNISQNDALSVREVNPSSQVQTMIKEGIINGSSMHQITSGSRQLAGQSGELRYAGMGGTETDRERLPTESMTLENDSTIKIMDYADSGNTGMIEELGATLSGRTPINGAHVTSEFNSMSISGISSASSPERRLNMTVESENLLQNMDLQKGGELVDSVASTQVLGTSSGPNTIGTLDTDMNRRERLSGRNMEVGGEGLSAMTNYTQFGDQAAQGGNDQVSASSGLGEGPSTSKIVHYVTSGGTVQQRLGEAKVESNEKGSSTVTQNITSGSTDSASSYQVAEQPIASVSTATVVGDPSVALYESSGGVSEENLGTDKIALVKGGSSTVTRFVATGTQRVVEERLAPETTSTLVDEGGSGSQGYVTEGNSAATLQLGGIPGGSEGQSEAVQYNLTSYTGPQPIMEQANGLETTTTGGAASTSTITGGDIGGNLGATIISRGNEGPLTVMRYVTTESTDTKHRIEQPDAIQSTVTSTVVGRAPLTETVDYATTKGEVQGSIGEPNMDWENSQTHAVTQAIGSSSTGHLVGENSLSQTEISQADAAPSSYQVIRYANNGYGSNSTITPHNNHNSTGEQQVDPSTPTSEGAASSSTTIRYVNASKTGWEAQGSEAGFEPNTFTQYATSGGTGITPESTATIVRGATTSTKIIRYITPGADGEERQEIVDESSLPLESKGVLSVTETPRGVAPKSTITFVKGAPTTSEIIRYITTADGEERQDGPKIVGDSNLALENENLWPIAETNPAVSGSKIIRYVTTANGVGQENNGDSLIHIENDGTLATKGTGLVVNEGKEIHSTGTIENNIPSGSRTIRYLKSGGMGTEQQFGQPMTVGNNGQSSVKRVFITGTEGEQEVIEQDTNSESIAAAVVGGSPATYRTVRYVSNDGVETQQMTGTSNTIQPSQTITRYVAMPGTNSASSGQTNLQEGGSTVIRYVNMPSSGGATSQLLSGPGDSQSSNTIVGGMPKTVTRYFRNYPQQSGMTGMRYVQSFQPRHASTIMKPASYDSG